MLFGTDGIRGRVGEYPIEPLTIVQIGWAVGRVLSKGLKRKQSLLVGKDTRVSGYVVESALESGIASAGVNVKLIGPVPTPAVAFLTRTTHACGGIVITASHNPYRDNGMKIFDASGQKISAELQNEVLCEMEKGMQVVPSDMIGKAGRLADYKGRYIEFCKSMLASSLDLSDLKITLDCANGSCYKVAPMMLAEMGADITVLGCNPNGYNINVDCGTEHSDFLRKQTLENGSDLGIALDGDGDRCVLIDEKGQIVDGDAILYILAQEEKGSKGVVGTQMSNFALEQELNQRDIPFYRAEVGDSNVFRMMREKNCLIGGEPSGHIIIEPGFTGDGISAALQIIQVMLRKEKTLCELVSDFHSVPQSHCSVQFKGARSQVKRKLRESEIHQWAMKELGSKGRAVIRLSGTQKLIRIMVESSDPLLSSRTLNELEQACMKLGVSV